MQEWRQWKQNMKQNEHRVVGSGAGKASASLCCRQKMSMMIPFFCWLPQINTQSLHCILPTDACALLFYSNHRCYGRPHLGHLRPWKPYNKRWKNPRFWSTPVKVIPGKQLKFKSLNSYSESFHVTKGCLLVCTSEKNPEVEVNESIEHKKQT